MSKARILITKRVYPEAVALLQENFEVDYEGTDAGLTTAQLIERAKGCQAVVSQLTDKLPAEVTAQLEGVKIIANVAVGYDNIDVPAATARGILVTNTPGVLTETTADFAFSLLMSAARRIPEAHAFVHSGEWKTWLIDLLAGQDIFGATLGIFGMGRIGMAVARRARGFGMRILYCDAQVAPAALEAELGLERVSKAELLALADFVSLHVPLTPETRHFIGAPELALMKPTAVLINTSRGPVVDEAALADALEQRQIWAAGLDVFEQEPAVCAKLLTLQNVVLAPHIASASVATRRRMSMMAAENAAAALDGRRPPNVLNPEVLG
ncbi:MAG TPA: D-glycerate dehydrogenase [Paludibaculum sp.]|jgi:glyoxylate reductase